MTNTLPGSAGPAHQPFRRPGVGRAFGERPGAAVSFRVLGFHDPLDAMSGRILGQATVAHRWVDPGFAGL